MAARPSLTASGPANPRFDADPPLGILVSARRIGLSLFELNLLTLDDFTSYAEMWVGDDDSDDSGDRRATQDDINRMLG